MKNTVLIISLTLLFTSFSSEAGKAEYFKKLDADQNQYLNISEFKVQMNKYFIKKNVTDINKQEKMLINAFKRRDIDGDGKISWSEFSTGPQQAKAKSAGKKS